MLTMKTWRNKKRYLSLFCDVVVISVIFLATGCVSWEKMKLLSKTITQNLIKEINVVETDKCERVTIEGESSFVYFSFKFNTKPLKLVVDIPKTVLAENVPATITVGDRVIKRIVNTRQKGDTRISISLNNLVRYQVQKEGNLLHIDIKKPSFLLTKGRKKKKEVEVVQMVPLPAMDEISAKELSPARCLIDILVDKLQKDKVILKLKADGRLGGYITFSLEKPTRLVIDLWNIKQKFSQRTFLVDSPYLKKVRFEDNPDKVRVVLDFSTESPPSYRIARVDDELIIVLGKDVQLGKR